MEKNDVVIVGGGLAGLCCARALHAAGVECLVLEADDDVGGRVRTDHVEGFQLDRGFQVFLAAYPEARRVLDYDALDLRAFAPGALVRFGGRFHRVTDPWRRPLQSLQTLFSPIGSFTDKLRVARLRRRVCASSLEELESRPETTTLRSLQKAGFSEAMIERFFRVFLGGIFLEPDLSTSSRMFDFVFRMFSQGPACVPAAGMGAIPAQLAAALPEESLHVRTRVDSISGSRVRLENGETVQARAVVVATAGQEAARLLPGVQPPASCPVQCLYFAAPSPPFDEPILVLDGEDAGPINNLCVMSAVAPTYAPQGRALVSVSVLGSSAANAEAGVRQQLQDWFGGASRDWELLRHQTIRHALPAQLPKARTMPPHPRVQSGLYLCGDHLGNASIQGAMLAGRRAAEAVIEDLAGA
ncbi:MAG: FAD-dependent oxidoreductase [Candidatus Latescibacterota bacterium]|nr:MAG: FAD-dependent oxidoreductase [Candidatus Latescibacterota bacterium]